MVCAPSEDSDQPGHPPSLIRVFAARSMGSEGPKLFSCGQRSLWSDWVDAQADLNLRWAHTHFVSFVMSRLKYLASVYLLSCILTLCFLSTCIPFLKGEFSPMVGKTLTLRLTGARCYILQECINNFTLICSVAFKLQTLPKNYIDSVD